MKLEERVSSALRSQTELLDPWTPDLESIRRTARRQTQQRVVAAVSGLAAAAVAVTMVTLGAGAGDRSASPVDQPDRGGVIRVDDRGVITIPRVRDDQVVVTPTVRSTASPGPRLVESLSSDDPSYDGSGLLSIPLTGGKEYSFDATCDRAPEAFLVVTLEPNAAYFDSERCNGQSISLADLGREPQDQVLRVFVTEDDPRSTAGASTSPRPQGVTTSSPPR